MGLIPASFTSLVPSTGPPTNLASNTTGVDLLRIHALAWCIGGLLNLELSRASH